MIHQAFDTFIRVAELGSFSRAAEELYVTPTAVNKKINLLEQQIGIKLFKRHNHGVTLTTAGQVFYEDAKYLLDYYDNALVKAKNAQETDEKVIRIGFSATVPAKALVDLLPVVQKKAPDLKFRMIPIEDSAEKMLEVLHNLGEEIDVMLNIFDPKYQDVRGYQALEIARLPVCCAVPKVNPLAEKKKLEIEDLYGQKLMLLSPGWSDYVDVIRFDLKREHPQIEIVDFPFLDMEAFNRCDNNQFIMMAFPQFENVHPLFKIIPVNWRYRVPYGILYAKIPSKSVRKFVEIIKTSYK